GLLVDPNRDFVTVFILRNDAMIQAAEGGKRILPNCSRISFNFKQRIKISVCDQLWFTNSIAFSQLSLSGVFSLGLRAWQGKTVATLVFKLRCIFNCKRIDCWSRIQWRCRTYHGAFRILYSVQSCSFFIV